MLDNCLCAGTLLRDGEHLTRWFMPSSSTGVHRIRRARRDRGREVGAGAGHRSTERLAREAVALSERNDSLDVQCLTLWDLAEVLAAASRPDDAAAALEQALERCRRKKNLALAAQVRARLEALKAGLSAGPATSP